MIAAALRCRLVLVRACDTPAAQLRPPEALLQLVGQRPSQLGDLWRRCLECRGDVGDAGRQIAGPVLLPLLRPSVLLLPVIGYPYHRSVCLAEQRLAVARTPVVVPPRVVPALSVGGELASLMAQRRRCRSVAIRCSTPTSPPRTGRRPRWASLRGYTLRHVHRRSRRRPAPLRY